MAALPPRCHRGLFRLLRTGTGLHPISGWKPLSHFTLKTFGTRGPRAAASDLDRSDEPLSPTRRSAKVTQEIAAHLAALGRSFEGQGHDGETVARFLMRCLLTMFAEDVELIPRDSVRDKLKELRGRPEDVAPTLESLWDSMNSGTFSPVLYPR